MGVRRRLSRMLHAATIVQRMLPMTQARTVLTGISLSVGGT